jgi:hypothetical protein
MHTTPPASVRVTCYSGFSLTVRMPIYTHPQNGAEFPMCVAKSGLYVGDIWKQAAVVVPDALVLLWGILGRVLPLQVATFMQLRISHTSPTTPTYPR